jgi:hypothetical protein
MEQIGPTFVKFAQLLSLRRDTFPDVYTGELANLQDQVTPNTQTNARAFLVGAFFMTLALLLAWSGIRALPAMFGAGERGTLAPVQRRP